MVNGIVEVMVCISFFIELTVPQIIIFKLLTQIYKATNIFYSVFNLVILYFIFFMLYYYSFLNNFAKYLWGFELSIIAVAIIFLYFIPFFFKNIEQIKIKKTFYILQIIFFVITYSLALILFAIQLVGYGEIEIISGVFWVSIQMAIFIFFLFYYYLQFNQYFFTNVVSLSDTIYLFLTYLLFSIAISNYHYYLKISFIPQSWDTFTLYLQLCAIITPFLIIFSLIYLKLINSDIKTIEIWPIELDWELTSLFHMIINAYAISLIIRTILFNFGYL